MEERGTTEDEVRTAIEQGDSEPARGNRVLYRKNFPYEDYWREKYYRFKQVAPVVARSDDQLVVVTVYVFYF
jgi:hypothetical protein